MGFQMNSAIFVSIAIVLLLLLWAGRRRRGLEPAAARGATPDPEELSVRLPPRGMLRRCLSREDLMFAESLGSAGVVRLLLQERRRLASEWLRLTRSEATRLFGLHVRMARYAADLRPLNEFSLLVQF